jgi:hypothetical protein
MRLHPSAPGAEIFRLDQRHKAVVRHGTSYVPLIPRCLSFLENSMRKSDASAVQRTQNPQGALASPLKTLSRDASSAQIAQVVEQWHTVCTWNRYPRLRDCRPVYQHLNSLLISIQYQGNLEIFPLLKMDFLILFLSNLHCPSCVFYNQDALSHLPRIEPASKVSLITRIIRVVHRNTVFSPHEIIEALVKSALEINHLAHLNSQGRQVADYDFSDATPL